MSPSPFILYLDSQLSSPYAMSVFVALTEKELPFSMQRLDLAAGEHLQSDYSRQSLTSRIPALAQGDFYLTESSAITEYLEEVFPAPQYTALYPADPVQRAKARQIQAWLRSDLMPLREERPTTVIFFTPSEHTLSEKGQAAAARLISAADQLIADQQTQLFDQWCIADTDLALMLQRLIKNGDPVPARLVAYANAQWERAAVKAWRQLNQH